jgi:hypothetical protein
MMPGRVRKAITHRSMIATLIVAIGASALAVATAARSGTGTGCTEQVQERLFFGLNGPDGAIPDAEWEAFVETVVTPRFPGGLTILHASGQWQGRDKQITRESSRVVEIIHDESKDASRRIAEIASEYKVRYRQDSVLIARGPVEVCF